MSWGTITVAGVALRETVRATQDGDSLKIAGQESHPPSTRAAVDAVHDNINALEVGVVVPVVFTDKAGLTGFYRLVGGGAVLTRIQNGAHITVDWSLDLWRVGGARDVEVESRVPTIARTTTIISPPAAVFWHAPAGGSGSYFTGPVAPSGGWVDRVSADGAVRVHLGIPAGVAPRWTVPAEAWMTGAARVLFSGIRRVGEHTPPLAAWEVTNGLVRLTPGASGAFTVECWDAGVWRSAKSFQVTVAGVAVTDVPEMTVLRNEPEEVAVRLTYATSPGRLTVDLSLRRGARSVTGVIKRHSAATLGLTRTAAEAAGVATGGLVAAVKDADGNRFILGSMVTVATTTATAAISKASVTALDFFVGHVADGSDETQRVAFGGSISGGTFTLSHGGQTTAPIAWNATAATVDAALEALSSIGAGNVATAGGPAPGTPVDVTFQGALGGSDPAQMTASAAGLTGPAPVTTATTTQGVPGVNEVQTVSFGGTVTGGTFTLTHNGQTTGAIAWNATAAAVQTALEALSTIGAGNVAVTGGPGPATYTLTFQAALRGTNVVQTTANGTALTGTAPTVSTATTTEGAAGTNEVQSVAFDSKVSGGTFTLTFSGQTTTAIAWNASAAAVQSALEALTNIGAGNVAVMGGPGPASYAVTFQGALRYTDVAQMTASGASLTGHTPTVTVTTTVPGVAVQAGDAFADLWAQYRGSSGTRTKIVTR